MFSKMLIFCLCFIGIFALLLGTMDSRFLAVQSLNANYQNDKAAAQTFAMNNLTAEVYVSFFLLFGDGNSHSETFNLPTGHEIEFWWATEIRTPIASLPMLEVRHTWPGFLGIGRSHEVLEVIYPYSESVIMPFWGLQKVDLEGLWENVNANASYCEWQKGGYNTKTFISPHNDIATIGQSWDAQNLTFQVGFTYDWNRTNVNAFDLLGAILFFQSPVFGVAGVAGTLLNAFIALPLWGMIAILAIKLIQSVIPFIKGIDE